MIYQCRYCFHPIRLYPGRPVVCVCGALYTYRMAANDIMRNADIPPVMRDVLERYLDEVTTPDEPAQYANCKCSLEPVKTEVPPAFYKAFEDEEAWQ